MTIAAKDIRRALEEVLAAAVPTWDGQGDVLLYDSFESANGVSHWVIGLGGTGAALNRATGYQTVRTGNFGLLFTAGSDPSAAAQLTSAPLSLPNVLAPVGFQFSFNLITPILSVTYDIGLFNGSNRTEFAVRWTQAGGVLAYFNAAGAWTNFGNLSLYTSAFFPLFHTGKLVVNPTSGSYARFIIDNQFFDLSANAGFSAASTTLPQIQTYFQLIGRAGFNDLVGGDDAFITVNEP